VSGRLLRIIGGSSAGLRTGTHTHTTTGRSAAAGVTTSKRSAARGSSTVGRMSQLGIGSLFGGSSKQHVGPVGDGLEEVADVAADKSLGLCAQRDQGNEAEGEPGPALDRLTGDVSLERSVC
jgi:hypothetical protein